MPINDALKSQLTELLLEYGNTDLLLEDLQKTLNTVATTHDMPPSTQEETPVMGRGKTRKLATREMHFYAIRPDREENIFWKNACGTYMENGGKQEYIDKLREDADLMTPMLHDICQKIRQTGPNDSIEGLQQTGTRLMKSFGRFRDYINRTLDEATQDWFAKVNRHRGKQSPITATQNTPINELTPRPAWDLVIDESGQSFEPGAENARNCFVGVLAPADDNVPPLNLHAVDYGKSVRQRILNDVISRQQWSMFGIRHSLLTPLQGDQWIDGISDLIAWVLRLLPISDEGTKLVIHIEQRRTHIPGSEQHRLERVLLQSLARVNPTRANLFDLHIKFINKYLPERIEKARKENTDYPTHKWLAYADLVSNLWFSQNKQYQKWMSNSGLVHRFLHEDLTNLHQRLLDAYFQEGDAVLSGDAWTTMLRDTRSRQSVIIDYISDLWVERTAKDPKQWARLMEELQRHLYSKSINMQLLIDQTDWLKKVNSQQTYELSPRDQLVFDMSLLAKRNHSGTIIYQREIEDLQRRQAELINEDIRLICFLDLHMAIQFSHSYSFDQGYQLMNKWANEETRMIGINYKGRVLSTMGQMMAFQHQHAEAFSYFDSALESFEMLSSTQERLAEQRHTRSYKVITMIDDPSLQNADIEREMLLLMPDAESMSHLCKRLISSNEDADKYIHHLFLRYLYFRQPENLLNQYTNGEKKWRSEHHHPWGWIQTYRGLLLAERQRSSAAKWFTLGLQEPSFRGIELAVGIVFLELTRQHEGTFHGLPIDDTLIKRKLKELQKKIPNATVFVDTIRSVRNNTAGSPREWLATALPFNFH